MGPLAAWRKTAACPVHTTPSACKHIKKHEASDRTGWRRGRGKRRKRRTREIRGATDAWRENDLNNDMASYRQPALSDRLVLNRAQVRKRQKTEAVEQPRKALPSPLEQQMGKIRPTERPQLPVVLLRYLLLTQHLQISRSCEPQLYNASNDRSDKNSLLGKFKTSLSRLPPVALPTVPSFHPREAYPAPSTGPVIISESDSVKYSDHSLTLPLFRIVQQSHPNLQFFPRSEVLLVTNTIVDVNDTGFGD